MRVRRYVSWECSSNNVITQEPPTMTVDSESVLLTVSEVADVLRTSRKAIYAMIERGQLPGLRRIGRRVLIRRADLLHWLDHNCASSLKG